jgi:uncharacterized Zn finger protein (UPF0148 family)
VRRQKQQEPTETACPKCGSKQIRHSYSVICSNDRCDADAERDPSDVPFAATETDQGESLDEALAKRSKDRSPTRKTKAKSTGDPSRDELSLGEMTRIVERVFRFDFDEAYDDVQRFLSPGDDRRLDLGFLQTELDRSPEMAALAHRLFTNAREACEIFEIDKGLIVASMREEARNKLDEDKRNRIRLKSVTDADVASMMQMQDPAKWRDLRVKTVRMEATRDHLERLSDLARKRIDVLKTLVERK